MESEYESKAKFSTRLVLLAQKQSLPTLPPLISLLLLLSPPPPYTISQSNYLTIIRQLQEQITVLEARAVRAVRSIEVAKPQIFDRASAKISSFVIVCKLYIRMKMREVTVEE